MRHEKKKGGYSIAPIFIVTQSDGNLFSALEFNRHKYYSK